MTHQEIAASDESRTTFEGGIVLMTPAVWELTAETRRRVLYRMSIYQKFSPDGDHSEAVFIFAGLSFFWRIQEFANHRSIGLMLASNV